MPLSTPYRIAAILLSGFAALHTYGLFADLDDMLSPSASTVLKGMKEVHFDFNGATDRTWYGFYRGFGLMVSLFLGISVVIVDALDVATLAMREDGGERRKEARVGKEVEALQWLVKIVAVTMFAAYVVTAGLTYWYFYPPPFVFSSVIAGLLGWEAWRI